MTSLISRGLAAIAVIGVLFTPSLHATPGQPGTLDASWGASSPLGAGKVITAIGGGDDFGGALAVQSDGKVVLAGYCYNGTKFDFCAARYNTDGALDTAWGTGGKVVTVIGSGSGHDFVTAIALQPDGKVLLAGACSNGVSGAFCAIRYNANGTLDTTWGVGGKVITAFDNLASGAYAMTLQADGKALLAGQCNGVANYDFCSARYNANGTLDITWGTDGKIVTPIDGRSSNATAISMQPDGKVLMAGECYGGTGADFCSARYNANGTLDATWGSGGAVVTPVGSSEDIAYDIAIQPDGKVLMAGQCYGSTSYDFCAVRYNANGTLDTTWGTGGSVITAIGSDRDYAYAIALQPDGKVLLAGSCVEAATYDVCTARYNADGTPDTSWGIRGKVITPVGIGNDFGYAIALQRDGKVLLAGSCSNGTNYDFCVARYDGGPFGYQNCRPDLDGDGAFLVTIDALIYTRIALGITGPVVVNGITFPPAATRNTWPLIRDYLVTQCGMSLVQ